jgi:hypothetical protein
MYNTGMTTNHEDPPLSKDELLARFIGNAQEHDREDVEFWRNASDQQRGRTFYRLLLQGRYITRTVPNAIAAEEDKMRLILKPHALSIITDYE